MNIHGKVQLFKIEERLGIIMFINRANFRKRKDFRNNTTITIFKDIGS